MQKQSQRRGLLLTAHAQRLVAHSRDQRNYVENGLFDRLYGVIEVVRLFMSN